MHMRIGKQGTTGESALRLYLFDNPILRLDMLLFRRRIAAMFTKYGWRTLTLYVLIPAGIAFAVSRWLFPPPYDKWSFVIFLKTTGTMTLAIIAVIAVIYYLVDCAILSVNPLGLRARDPLVDDPPIVDDYERMLFVARAIHGIKLFPLVAWFGMIVVFHEPSDFMRFGNDVGWYAALTFLLVSAAIATMHFLAIFNLVFFYTNSVFVRIVAAVGVAIATASPFFVGKAMFNSEYALINFDVGKPIISAIAWAFHPFGTAAAFYNGMPQTRWTNYGIHMDDIPLVYILITIVIQIMLVYFAWKLVRMRFKKMIHENYLGKAKRG